ncbi:hypothetical protein BJ123_10874 [Rhodopseudomonas thermotolerans]|uniref:Uncharacterized protein n=2 Tax=Rhodopseudomonas TaxID=1073 RepID=A0A336JXC8_9BRAD|nr:MULTISPECIES: hypothetical protein [Rhodopseudomonas]RED36141.1 hypothetical protein BJ125_10874 [Rhodopseudomonas pentothenatexigens]REG03513.1 hypothetical protein BJ123_10874 [Rhodopseudomonas thermotolerans]SSW90701.1 hypothetical protein SAMN05892882_10874 [Rhodopseudomonas pentothenatexigens]
MTTNSLFDKAMFEIYRRAKEEANYNATIFLQMLTETDGLTTAKSLINATKPSLGYTALFMKGRLDLTVEAVVTENKQWAELFTDDEIERAKKRLLDYQYKPKNWIA